MGVALGTSVHLFHNLPYDYEIGRLATLLHDFLGSGLAQEAARRAQEPVAISIESGSYSS
jgi:hypothetical protein